MLGTHLEMSIGASGDCRGESALAAVHEKTVITGARLRNILLLAAAVVVVFGAVGGGLFGRARSGLNHQLTN
jgi:hypothetical protein